MRGNRVLGTGGCTQAGRGKRGVQQTWVSRDGCRHEFVHWLLFLLCVVVQLCAIISKGEVGCQRLMAELASPSTT